MNISNIRVKKINSTNRLKAFVSIVIDDSFVINDIKIIEGDNGLFLGMPSTKLPNSTFKDIVHPINAQARDELYAAVMEAYKNCPDEQEESNT